MIFPRTSSLAPWSDTASRNCHGWSASSRILGANPLVTDAGLAVDPTVLPKTIAFDPDTLVPYYFNLIADNAPWLVGLLAVCALAAMQSTGAAYMSTGGGIRVRPSRAGRE